MSVDLAPLLQPRSIAVIGATESPGKPGRAVLEALLGLDATIYPVNPGREHVLSLRAYPSVIELPEVPHLAVVALGASAAVVAAEECAELGVPFIIVLAGGFSESNEAGRCLQARLEMLRERYPTRVLGPNTLGIQVSGGVDTVFVEHATFERPGSEPDVAFAPRAATVRRADADEDARGVVLISQSGSVAIEAMRLAAPTGFALRAFIGLGNECDLSALDFITAFGSDGHTSCLCLYMEHLGGGRPLLEAARKASANMPVIMLKAGRTARGAVAASSHTGRLAGSDRVVAGALRQFGIQRALDDEELFDAARAFTYAPRPRGNRVAIVTAAGGYGVMCVDLVEDEHRVRLELARISERTRESIASVSLAFASVDNPVDLTAGTDDETYGHALRALLEDEGVDIVIPVVLFAPQRITDRLVDEIADAARTSRKPVVVFCEEEANTTARLGEFADKGVVAYPSIARAVRAVRVLVERARIEGTIA